MRRFIAVLSALAFALIPVAPVAADHEDPHPTFRTERVYFRCQDQTLKLDNVQATMGSTATWDTNPPSGAFAGEGAGCGSAEPTLRSNAGVALDTAWEGTFTGNLAGFTVLLHDISHRADVVDPQLSLIARLWVDDVLVLDDSDVTPVATAANSGVTHSFEFSVYNLPYGTEDGDGETVRTIRLELRSRDASFFVWDAEEVPSGITFNPTTLAPDRIPVS